MHLHEEKCNFWLYFTFNFRGFAKNSYLSLYINFSTNVYFIAIGQQLRTNYWKKNANYFVYLGFYWKDISENSRFYFTHFATTNIRFVVIRRQLSALYLKINIACCPINGFHEMDLTENPYLSPPHTLPTRGIYWLCSDNN